MDVSSYRQTTTIEPAQTQKTTQEEVKAPKTLRNAKSCGTQYIKYLRKNIPTVSDFKQYSAVLICGLSLWMTSWFIFEDLVFPGGYIFDMTALVVIGYLFGHMLQKYTSINAVVGMTLVGALARNLVPINFIENPMAYSVDYHLRRIYPVIILTKGPLSWNWEYIKQNSVKVFSLATMPWIIECLSTAFFTFIFLEFPWYWGLHLGAILSSVSPAVVVPTLVELDARGFGTKNKIAHLVGNAGGLDTAFTEGMFGVINSAIFYQSAPEYRIVKALLAIFVGIGLGVVWGFLADILPEHNDIYAPTIRSLHIFSGGILITFAASYFGWGGTSGVSIMVCSAAAATRWSRRGWAINKNPVSEVYKLLWTLFEPMLFTLSGYFLEVKQISAIEFGYILACIFSALLLRLLTAFLIALANELSVKESIFIAITWIPKAIVEAVLVRVATDSLWQEGATDQDRKIAAQHSNIIVISILITSTIGSLLTTLTGPLLLSESKAYRQHKAQERYRNRSTIDVTSQNHQTKELQYNL
ncbi:sodium/hydrogen exchanger 9B2-like isoform X2 [Leptidea sinapis]|uniref:sodium/hydrogen exchanger 9B2-like isoform X2 n=1 Tax=Leptidea sinapis TaxID=189913 RepID=UPI0021C28B22|nr:sodium/hydrogen exchanger 9B2-like isoform X2 [Leptidea sinapis]